REGPSSLTSDALTSDLCPEELPPLFPFTPEQVDRVARTEPTLRDMLQQFRHLFDHLVYGRHGPEEERPAERPAARPPGEGEAAPSPEARLPAEETPVIKSVVVVETPAGEMRPAECGMRNEEPASAPADPRVVPVAAGTPAAPGDDSAFRTSHSALEL